MFISKEGTTIDCYMPLFCSKSRLKLEAVYVRGNFELCILVKKCFVRISPLGCEVMLEKFHHLYIFTVLRFLVQA